MMGIGWYKEKLIKQRTDKWTAVGFFGPDFKAVGVVIISSVEIYYQPMPDKMVSSNNQKLFGNLVDNFLESYQVLVK